MNITIVCVGKCKESFYREAIAEYSKRLSRYCRLKIVEAADEPTPEGAGAALEGQIKDTEGERIIRAIPSRSYVIALAIEGKRSSSEAFAERIDHLALEGVSDLTFVIGGSLGLSSKVLAMADLKLSFSDMTFPHQLMRVILLEQIYRAFRIIRKEPYHK